MTCLKLNSLGKLAACLVFALSVSSLNVSSSYAATLPSVQAQEIALAKRLVAAIRPAGYDLSVGVATVFMTKACIKDMKRVTKDVSNTNYQTNLIGPNGKKLNGFKDYVGRVNTLMLLMGYPNKTAALAGKERLQRLIAQACSVPAPVFP